MMLMSQNKGQISGYRDRDQRRYFDFRDRANIEFRDVQMLRYF